jgi:hypothetical protein
MVTLDEKANVYRDIRGQPLPRITTVLNQLEDFRHVPHDILEYARILGTAVHEACEYYDRSTLDTDTVDPVVAPYLAGYGQFLHDENPEILMIEQVVSHGVHKYAGRLDRGMRLRGRRAIVDLKTPKDVRVALVGPQTAAQLEALNYMLRTTMTPAEFQVERYERRWALQLTCEGTYKLVELSDTADLAVFLSCLNCMRWKEKYGLRT